MDFRYIRFKWCCVKITSVACSRNGNVDNTGILPNEIIVLCIIDMFIHGSIHHWALYHVTVNSAEFIVSLKQQS